MHFSITEQAHVMTLRLVGNAPAGSEGFRWAEGALSEFRRRLDCAPALTGCRLDFARLVYHGGDFIAHFAIPPIHRGLDTQVEGSPEMEAALKVLLRGAPYRYRVVCA